MSARSRVAPVRVVIGVVLLLPIGVAGPAVAQTAAPDTAGIAPPDTAGIAPPDTTYGGLLDRLRREDDAFYTPEILEIDPAVRDSALAAFDSLGIEEYRRLVQSRRPFVEFSLDPAGKLMTYHRAEGLVVGLAADFLFRNNTEVVIQGAYATASKKFRHHEEIRIPIARRTYLEAGYADRVAPYGSNRPTLNSVRALFGGADEQDYLRREGGWAALRIPWGRFGEGRLGYEAGKESSIAANTTFAFVGDMDSVNAPVDEGYDRSIIVRGTLGSIAEDGAELTLGYRIAGGGLGGDFSYTRGDAGLSLRRYLPANHEMLLDLGFSRAGGSPPVQRVSDLGGLGSIRGFPRRTRVGKSAFRARAELLVPYDLLAWTRIPVVKDLRLQLVPWGDAGRAWDGNGDLWLTSAGAGIQRYLGPWEEAAFLRLDAAFPLGPERPDTVIWYLHFTRSLF